MKCPHCNAWTTVLRTRGTQRRRECANLHRFNTQEKVVGRIIDAAASAKKNDEVHPRR